MDINTNILKAVWQLPYSKTTVIDSPLGPRTFPVMSFDLPYSIKCEFPPVEDASGQMMVVDNSYNLPATTVPEGTSYLSGQ